MSLESDPPERLDEIATQWSLLRLAHRDAADNAAGAGAARGTLALRYGQAVRSYVGALVRDEHDADEVAQEVLVRMLKGDFARATPERGRFRDLLKVAVKNMVRTYWDRRQRTSKRNVDVADFAVDEASPEQPADASWLAAWRAALLDAAWRALERYQYATRGNHSYTLLRLRADYPDDDTEALAERLAQVAGVNVRPDAVRQQLRRARLRFAELLVEEVARSLVTPGPEQVEEELADLELMEYVRDFLPADWREKGELR